MIFSENRWPLFRIALVSELKVQADTDDILVELYIHIRADRRRCRGGIAGGR